MKVVTNHKLIFEWNILEARRANRIFPFVSFHFYVSRTKMQAQFNEKYAEWRSTKKIHYILETDEYQARVDALTNRDAGQTLSKDERNWANRFVMEDVNGSEKLMHVDKQGDTYQVLTKDEVFGVLDAAHNRLGHVGRAGMEKDLSKYYGLSK
jgi:hypothetical protein